MTERIGKALANAIKEPASAGSEKRGRHIFRNQRRREIFSILTKTPFVSGSMLASVLDLSANTVKWHLNILLKEGYVEKCIIGRQVVFFPEGLVGKGDGPLLHSVNHPRHAGIYGKTLRKPGLSQSEIAAATRESRHTVARALADQESLGLLTVVIDGKHSRFYPTRLLPDRAEGFFKHSRNFSVYILRKLEQEGGSSPEIVKRGLDIILVEIGYASDRFAMEIGINPFMTCKVC